MLLGPKEIVKNFTVSQIKQISLKDIQLVRHAVLTEFSFPIFNSLYFGDTVFRRMKRRTGPPLFLVIKRVIVEYNR